MAVSTKGTGARKRGSQEDAKRRRKKAQKKEEESERQPDVIQNEKDEATNNVVSHAEEEQKKNSPSLPEETFARSVGDGAIDTEKLLLKVLGKLDQISGEQVRLARRMDAQEEAIAELQWLRGDEVDLDPWDTDLQAVRTQTGNTASASRGLWGERAVELRAQMNDCQRLREDKKQKDQADKDEQDAKDEHKKDNEDLARKLLKQGLAQSQDEGSDGGEKTGKKQKTKRNLGKGITNDIETYQRWRTEQDMKMRREDRQWQMEEIRIRTEMEIRLEEERRKDREFFRGQRVLYREFITEQSAQWTKMLQAFVNKGPNGEHRREEDESFTATKT